MKDQIEKKQIIVLLLISIGIFLRFLFMTWGHNFDWESYCIVGKIASQFKNVYAETGRYNYGPIFLYIQGFLYNIANARGYYNENMYRVLMVAVLTTTDLGIAMILAKRYSIRKALIFFLNPISIIITGYHNQFDNIAVLLALCTFFFYNEEERFNRRDIGFVLTLALCLMTKHILFMMPVFLLVRRGLYWKKRMVYACVPMGIFLLSFLPFSLENQGLQGIINHVFLYRSENNFPLLHAILEAISVPKSLWFALYIILMILVAVLTREYTYESQLFIYLIAMVAFSSAIANQYLAIPMAALCVFDVRCLRYCYMIINTAFLAVESSGLDLYSYIMAISPTSVGKLVKVFAAYGYDIAAWVLFAVLICILYKKMAVEAGTLRREE